MVKRNTILAKEKYNKGRREIQWGQKRNTTRQKMHWLPIEEDDNAKEKYKSYQLIADVQYKVQQFCSPEIQKGSITYLSLNHRIV